MEKARLDKWLWAARFYKTRNLAAEEIKKGRVQVNNQAAKAAREIRVGDEIQILKRPPATIVVVEALSLVRGPASVAQTLYKETAASIQAREQAAEQRRLAPEPAHSLDMGRPTKRDRRAMEKIRRFYD